MNNPYSTLILGCSRWTRIPHVEVKLSRYLEQFGYEIIFKVFQRMWNSRLVPVRSINLLFTLHYSKP